MWPEHPSAPETALTFGVLDISLVHRFFTRKTGREPKRSDNMALDILFVV